MAAIKVPSAQQIVNGVLMTSVTLFIINRITPLRRFVNGA